MSVRRYKTVALHTSAACTVTSVCGRKTLAFGHVVSVSLAIKAGTDNLDVRSTCRRSCPTVEKVRRSLRSQVSDCVFIKAKLQPVKDHTTPECSGILSALVSPPPTRRTSVVSSPCFSVDVEFCTAF